MSGFASDASKVNGALSINPQCLMPALSRLRQYPLPSELFLKEMGIAQGHPIGGTKFNEEVGISPIVELMEHEKILGQLRFGQLQLVGQANSPIPASKIFQDHGEVGERSGIGAKPGQRSAIVFQILLQQGKKIKIDQGVTLKRDEVLDYLFQNKSNDYNSSLRPA